jgi:hypothetical protein
MCVRAYRRRVSVVDVRVFRACARGERFLGVINITESGRATFSSAFTLQAHTGRVRRHRYTRRASKAASAATGLVWTAPDHAWDARRLAITRYGGALVGAAARNKRINTKRPPRPRCPQ